MSAGSRLFLPHAQVRTVVLAGAGSVGKGWAALLLAKGYDVVVFDPQAAPAGVARFVEQAWPALVKLGTASAAAFDPKRLRFAGDLAAAIGDADLVFENAPEKVELKQALIAQIDALLPPDRLILS